MEILTKGTMNKLNVQGFNSTSIKVEDIILNFNL